MRLFCKNQTDIHFGKDLFLAKIIYKHFKSLILAQDERWRRA